MATRVGHEHCWFCRDCGLPLCPDCDTEGRSCPCSWASASRRQRLCVAPFPNDVDLGDYSRGSAVVEYVLLSVVVILIGATFVVLMRTVASDMLRPASSSLTRTREVDDSNGGIGRAGLRNPPAVTPPPTYELRRP